MAKYSLPDPYSDCDQFPGSSWSKRLSAHVADLQGQITKLKYEVVDQNPRALVIAERAEIHLQAARAALRTTSSTGSALTGVMLRRMVSQRNG